MKFVIVGTAGHVDHGKSALVKALTGTDPDRWEEEKRRGITIDLGFAELDLGGDVHVGFVDVPGHERFVKNMLAGAGGFDMVLLVIAADESIKPQTREHFDICRLLGIERGVVALTKSDLVERDVLDLVTLEIQDFVAGSFLEGAPVVPVSSLTGEGFDRLRAELRRVGLEAPERSSSLPFRLPIDRAFIIKGFGAVVTGTLIAGRIEKEQEVEISPLARRARVRGIQIHNRAADAAFAGQRTALNLAGIDAQDLERGMMLAPPGLFEATGRLDVSLELLPSSRALKNHARVHFHCWTAEGVADMALLDKNELAPGESVPAQLHLAERGLFLPGDRFILRQFSPVVTIGGGVILDGQPLRHRFGDPRVVQALRVLKDGSRDEQVEHFIKQAGEISVASLVARTGLAPQEILNVASRLALEKRVRTLGQPPSALVHESHYAELRGAAELNLEQFHTANPLIAGISREELATRLATKRDRELLLPSAMLIGEILQNLLEQNKIVVEGDIVRLAGRGNEMTPEEAGAKKQIAEAFERAGLAVPSAKEVLGGLRLDRTRAEKILKILLREGTLVKLSEELIFHAGALARLREMVVRHKTQNNRIDVGVFKELTGLTRKYAIPLLEYLDRERVTRRVGDERII
ncbi:MAG: selenocysteine-specific translation elongation factor, partial [Acidobacteria bacterium]|nr:selenocysteine-specific translation elongation factor [Acidobacteriota bacterium]